MSKLRRRRVILVLTSLLVVVAMIFANHSQFNISSESPSSGGSGEAKVALDLLEVKGRAPKTDYKRAQFGAGWQGVYGCSVRNLILARDLAEAALNEKCQVVSGVLNDPYTSEVINFKRGADTSDDVQIDHVVALSNAWQTGAQGLSYERRVEFANDPLNLLAVSGEANQQKSSSDAASWLPPNKSFRCQYVARQVAVKSKYSLWVTAPEKQAIGQVLESCPGQDLPK